METESFDRLAAALGQSRTRRATVRLLGAALLGAGGLAALGEHVDAKEKKRHHHSHHHHGGGGGAGGGSCNPPCPSGQTCQNGTCVPSVGDGGCNPPCGPNHVCQNGTCVCVPQCQGKNCGDDGCGNSCGSCSAPTCQGTTLTTQTCDAGVCTPHPASCGAGQRCFQDACCTPRPQPTCHRVAVSDGCGGSYPPNCTHNCCDGPNGNLICQTLACQ